MGGGALVVVVVGFASQRLLVDVIAGFFILFEDQYGIGDVVRLEPSGYTGEVRTLGLRATVLLGPGGERMIVPNGQITAVRLLPSGRRRHRLEFLTREPDLVTAAITELAALTGRAGGPWRSDARVVRHDGPDGLSPPDRDRRRRRPARGRGGLARRRRGGPGRRAPHGAAASGVDLGALITGRCMMASPRSGAQTARTSTSLIL